MRGHAEPIITRLWKLCEPEPNTGCWLWTITRNRKGYGLVTAGGKTRHAHRVAYELAVGPIPSDMCVLHKCDMPSCINPAHLFLGTNADNMADRDRKHRQMRWERHFLAKLNRAAVLDIRARWQAGGITKQALADEYEVDPRTIAAVVEGRTWKEVA
jgi:hypothetical protein